MIFNSTFNFRTFSYRMLIFFEVWVSLHWTRSNAKRKLATFASGRLRHLLKIGHQLATILSKPSFKQQLAKFASS